MPSPLFDYDLSLAQALEDIAVEKLVSKPGFEEARQVGKGSDL